MTTDDQAAAMETDIEMQGGQRLAKAIREVAAAARKLLNAGLTEECIIVLIQESTSRKGKVRGVAKDTIREVLKTAAQLDKQYTVDAGCVVERATDED